jgi:hypothetical protein
MFGPVHSSVVTINQWLILLNGRLHETAKIGLIFAVRLILPGGLSNFCKHPTDRHHIAQNWMER